MGAFPLTSALDKAHDTEAFKRNCDQVTEKAMNFSGTTQFP